MAIRKVFLSNNNYYHIYSRSIAKYIIFNDEIHVNYNEHHVLYALFNEIDPLINRLYPDKTKYYRFCEDDKDISILINHSENIETYAVKHLAKIVDKLIEVVGDRDELRT